MEQQTLNRTSTFDPEIRRYDDATTWFAEMVEGNMRTSFEYSFDGRELYGRDGGAIRPIFEDAIKEAERIVETQPNLAFELRRRPIEREEYCIMLEMARGDRPNTMIVESDFPPELMDSQEDVGGWNIKRKPTMQRVITKITKGNDVYIRVCTQSLDQSNRMALEEIYRSLGFEPQPGELLGQRMHLELDEADQELIADQLMGVYDRSLQAQFGGHWRAGRQPIQYINTYDFVRAQTDLLDEYLAEEDSDARDRIAYGFAATMEKRFKDFVALHRSDPQPVYTLMQPQNRAQEMYFATREAVREGKRYSGCGRTVGPEELSTEDELQAAGYGNKKDKQKEESDDLPDLIRCINCKEKVPSKDVVKPNTWCCPNCKYEVDICTGKVICAGTIKIKTIPAPRGKAA